MKINDLGDWNRLKNIISLFLLMVFLMPSIVKLEHHHKHLISRNKMRLPIRFLHEKCPICNFEFSVFLTEYWMIMIYQKEKPLIII